MDFFKDDIEEQRSIIRNKFLELYSQRGFNIHTPLDLNISYDPSLLFVNCSICHFKKQYFAGEQLDNYCVSQPALRTNTYRDLQANQPLFYTAELEMLGAFSQCDNTSVKNVLDVHFRAQADYIRLILKENEITVDFSSELYDLLDRNTIQYLLDLNINIVIKEEPIKWRYGIDNIAGIGTNWYLHSKTQRYDFGNVVLLFNEEKKYIGVESGGAIESILRIIYDFPHKIYANSYCTEYIAKELSTNRPYVIEYYDALNVLSNIAFFYTDISPLQLKPIFERYIRTVKSYIILYDISENTLKTDTYNIAMYHMCWKHNPDKLYLIIRKYIDTNWDVDLLIKNRKNKKNISFRGMNHLEMLAIDKCLVTENR